MVPRKRSQKNKGLPENLHTEVKGKHIYYRYKHPITKKYHRMGTDKTAACAAARQLNARLAVNVDLVSSVLGLTEQTIGALIDKYKKEFLPKKELGQSTLDHYERRLKRIDKDLGAHLLEQVDTQLIAEYLDTNFERDAYIKHRQLLVDLFKFAMTKGWWTKDNPAQITYAKADTKKQRKRMTLKQFKAIREAAPDYMQIAMDIAILTLQGRYEVLNMRYDDIKNEHIYITREKTKKNEWAKIRIAMTKELGRIIARSRQSGVVSPYIVHRKPERQKDSENRQHWTQLTLNDFSARFREIRDNLKIFKDMPKNTRPTFHEIRALGSHLYEKAGYQTEYVQKLMAHSDEKMTEYYQSGHEEKWLEVRADMSLKDILG